MRIFLIALLALILTTPSVFSQIPFEKNGKWGLLSETTQKPIIKPKYLSLVLTTVPDLYIGSLYKEIKYIGVKPQYGVINSKGEELVPFYADSISIENGIIISHNSMPKLINDTKAISFPFTVFYSINGNKISRIEGLVKNSFPGGYIVMEFEAKNKYVTFLYNNKYERIGDTVTKNKIYPKYIETSNKHNRKHLSGPAYLYFKEKYTLYDINTFEPIVIDYENSSYLSEDGMTLYFQKDDKKGFLNTDNNKITYVGGSHSINIDGYTVRYDGNYENPFIVLTDGKTLPVFKILNDNGKEVMFYQNENGEKLFCGIECEDVIPYVKNNEPLVNQFSVKKGGKWGLYNTYKQEMLLPFIYPAPVTSQKEDLIIVSQNDSSRVYDKYGNLQFDINAPKINISKGLVFIGEEWSPSGIYSLSLRKWIVPQDRYSEINYLGELFAVKTGSNSFSIINKNGQIVNTLSNVYSVNGSFYFGDIVKIYDKNHKMGLINRNTGQVIAQPLFEDDIAWGSGTGENQRFAVTQKKDKGEEVIVMTVGGKKIASQFFPYGTKPIVIKNFGKKYLYQSF